MTIPKVYQADDPTLGLQISKIIEAVESLESQNLSTRIKMFEDLLKINPIAFIPRGVPFPWPGEIPPTGAIKTNGAELLRAEYSDFWNYIQKYFTIITDAEWQAGRRGCYSSGNGTTTFRILDVRGVVLRGLDDGRGLDPGRVQGSYQGDDNKQHRHDLTIAGYAYRDGNGVQPGFVSYNVLNARFTDYSGGVEARMKNIAEPFYIKV